MLKTPKFWYPKKEQKISVFSICLTPLSWIYRTLSHMQIDRQPKMRTSVPVICVGNIVAGGAGKTPVTIALADLCYEMGIKSHILSRGYGASVSYPDGHFVSDHDQFPNIGDEPLLMARTHPVCVASKRTDGAQKITQETDADLIIMDDGLQNRDLYQDLKFLVIDGVSGIGNGQIIPAGPLRETWQHALNRIDAVIVIGDDVWGVKQKMTQTYPDIAIFDAMQIFAETGWDKDQKYIGFCGLGRPEKFAKTLDDLSISYHAFHKFADHYPYTDHDIEKLLVEAKQKQAKLITTEKDLMRIPKKYHAEIDVVPMRITWQNEDALKTFIMTKLPKSES